MTQGERRSLNRLSVAAHACVWAVFALVVLLGLWGAYRDDQAAQAMALRKEIATRRLHAVRTVGRIERGLEHESNPRDLAVVLADPWIRQYWERVVPVEDPRLYAAIVDSTDSVVMHSDPKLEGRRLEHDWYDRVCTEIAPDVFETRSDALAAGRRAYDICVPIDVAAETVGQYHAGFDVEWFDEQNAIVRRQVALRWTIVIGGILVVVSLAGASFYYIANRAAAMRNTADIAHLQRVTELGQVAVGLAHEIRNPLHAIRLNLHAVGRMHNGRAKLSADEVATIISQTNDEISRLDRLIGELLGFAKPDEAREEDIDLVGELRATLSFVGQDVQSSGVQLCTQIPDQKAVVHMDPTRLRQIMLNLLMNAKEAAGDGGRIDVGLTHMDERVEIRVSDDGPGITDDDRQHIYDPFYTTKEGGSGLGLALVKRFVEEADGSIRCQSEESGTTFCISMPAVGRTK